MRISDWSSDVCSSDLGNTTFVKSYDGVTTSGGQNFMAELARLQKTNDKVDGPYDTVEIPFEIADDVKDPKSSAVFEARLETGYTPSLNGYKDRQSVDEGKRVSIRGELGGSGILKNKNKNNENI